MFLASDFLSQSTFIRWVKKFISMNESNPSCKPPKAVKLDAQVSGLLLHWSIFYFDLIWSNDTVLGLSSYLSPTLLHPAVHVSSFRAFFKANAMRLEWKNSAFNLRSALSYSTDSHVHPIVYYGHPVPKIGRCRWKRVCRPHHLICFWLFPRVSGYKSLSHFTHRAWKDWTVIALVTEVIWLVHNKTAIVVNCYSDNSVEL